MEPVVKQTKEERGGRRFLHRELAEAKSEWRPIVLRQPA